VRNIKIREHKEQRLLFKENLEHHKAIVHQKEQRIPDFNTNRCDPVTLSVSKSQLLDRSI
jgi:hypothetical protein